MIFLHDLSFVYLLIFVHSARCLELWTKGIWGMLLYMHIIDYILHKESPESAEAIMQCEQSFTTNYFVLYISLDAIALFALFLFYLK